MERKEKIVLNDGTEFNIENGAVENRVQIVCSDFDDIKSKYEKFTEYNLEKYLIQNADGLTCATIENKYLIDILVTPRDSDIIVSFNLADVDMVKKKLAILEASQKSLQEAQKNLEESQNIQDGAIDELGTMVSDLTSENTTENSVETEDEVSDNGGE